MPDDEKSIEERIVELSTEIEKLDKSLKVARQGKEQPLGAYGIIIGNLIKRIEELRQQREELEKKRNSQQFTGYFFE